MAGAGLRLLQNFHESDSFRFERMAMNPALPPRSFSSLWAMAEEVGQSRIHGGLHFSFSNCDALDLGVRLADHVWTRFLTPP